MASTDEKTEIDAASVPTTTPTSSDGGSDGDASALKEVLDTKVDGGKKSAWAMTLETFNMSDGGKSKKSDVKVGNADEAMEELEKMIAEVKSSHRKWEFQLTQGFLNEKQTTQDMYMAFIKWAKKEHDDEEDNNSDKPIVYNVSKAFRRLESYATWMEDNRKDLEEPISIESIAPAAKAWACLCTHDTKKKRFVWYIDISEMDVATVKNDIPHVDSLRYVVWLSHIMMLDENAQDNGMVFVEAMGKKGLWESLFMIPMDISTKMDRLTIGTLPIKMKLCYVYQGARWIHIMMALMKPFMSKKMRQRIVVLNDKKQSAKDILQEELGRDSIPKNFGGLEGTAETDIIFGQYITQK